MDILKKIFPLSFGAAAVADLVIKIIIYVVGGAVASAVIGLLTNIPIIGVIIGIAGGFVGLYSLIGIVLLLLDYFKVLK